MKNNEGVNNFKDLTDSPQFEGVIDIKFCLSDNKASSNEIARQTHGLISLAESGNLKEYVDY